MPVYSNRRKEIVRKMIKLTGYTEGKRKVKGGHIPGSGFVDNWVPYDLWIQEYQWYIFPKKSEESIFCRVWGEINSVIIFRRSENIPYPPDRIGNSGIFSSQGVPSLLRENRE